MLLEEAVELKEALAILYLAVAINTRAEAMSRKKRFLVIEDVGIQ